MCTREGPELCRCCCLKSEWARKGLRIPGSKVCEWGTKGDLIQGQRTDLQMFIEEAKSGVTYSTLMDSQSEVCAKYFSFSKAYCAAQRMKNIPAWRTIETTVYWGFTGVGKTRRVFHDYPDVYKLDPCGEGKLWFDGYEGQSVLLLDDFYGWLPIGTLLNLLDGYRLRLNVKNSYTYALWTKIFITSNVAPISWYCGEGFGQLICGSQRDALMRRLTNIVHVTDEWLPVVNETSEDRVLLSDDDDLWLGAEARDFGGEQYDLEQ